MRFIVVGAGIGGCVAALTLLREGYEVTLLEKASEFGEVGAGIQISSNGTIVLRELGLAEELASVAVRPESIDFVDLESGEDLYRAPLGDMAAERYGGDFFQIHRADLLNIISSVIPKDVVRFNTDVQNVWQTGSAAMVKLSTGEELVADGVIGADGIHSVVRERIWGPENPRFANKLSWRALLPADRLSSVGIEERGYLWTGPGRTTVGYWVRPGALFNFLGTVPSNEVRRESYTISGDLGELRQSFEGAEPRVAHLVDSIDEAFITGLYFRDSAKQWSKGRVTLLGDSAHAMVPYLAQGACASIEDAWILARCLSRGGKSHVPEAFVEYEKRRIPRTTRVQSASRAMVKQVHETDPVEIRARNGRLKGMSRIDPLSETVWGWLYEYNPLIEAEAPLEKVIGLTDTFVGRRMKRPESQRAFDLFEGAFTPEDVAAGIHGLRAAYDRFLSREFPVPQSLRFFEVDETGAKGFWVEPDALNTGRVILHLHGGGYVMGSAKGSLEFAGRMANATDSRCFTVDYRLAPEHPYPAALEDSVSAYRWLLEQDIPPNNIMISGESAGGGLAVSTVLKLVQLGLPLPGGVVSLSPMTDLTVTGHTVRKNTGEDPAVSRNSLTLFAGSYFQANDPTDPLISPVTGEFEGFPPLMILAATGEVLESDATMLADAAESAGVDVSIKLVDDSVHVFPLFSFLPESSEALKDIRDFANRYVDVVPSS